MKYILFSAVLFLPTLASAQIVISRPPSTNQCPQQPVKFCGLKGTLKERLKDCKSEGPKEGTFRLVSRHTNGETIHLDTVTKVLWGPEIGRAGHETALEYCQEDGKTVFYVGIKDLSWTLPSVEDFQDAESRSLIDYVLGRNTELLTSTRVEPYESQRVATFKTTYPASLGHTKKYETYQWRCIAQLP